MVVRSAVSEKSKAGNAPTAHRRNSMNVKRSNKPIKRLSHKVNLSRKQILAARKAILENKKMQQKAVKRAAKQTRIAEVQKVTNKKTIKTFDRLTLRVVQDGLVEAIIALNEPVTPLSLFMASLTALSKSPEKHQIPYLLSITAACLSRLSQGMLHRQCESLFVLCEQLITENVNTNMLVVTKAMKLIQTLLLSVQTPTLQLVHRYVLFNPSKLRASLAELYLINFRKFLEQAALFVEDGTHANDTTNSVNITCTKISDTSTTPSNSFSVTSSATQQMHTVDNNKNMQAVNIRVKNATTHYYSLSAHQLFFVNALPEFVNVCINNLSDSSASVAIASLKELSLLFSRTLSPYIVESKEGCEMINQLLRDQLISLLKPVYQPFWTHALQVLESLFNRLSYVKRLPERSSMPFTTLRFPAVVFLLKVLNKMRVMNDQMLNGKIERVIVAIGNGMTVKEFVEILPFDPRLAYEAEIRGFAHVPQENNIDVDNDEDDDDYEEDEELEDEAIGINGNEEQGNLMSKQNGDIERKSKSIRLKSTHHATRAAKNARQRRVDPKTLWSTSYTLNILRRISSHDSLPFCLEEFFPQIQFCSRHAVEAEHAGQHDEFNRWSALLIQFWRIVVGFCHFPVDINNNSFRDLAKQLVGLLGNDTFVDISANALHTLCSGYYQLSQTAPLYGEEEDDTIINYDDNDDNDTIASNGNDVNKNTFFFNARGNNDRNNSNLASNITVNMTGNMNKQNNHLTIRKEALEDDELFLRLNDCEWAPHIYHNISPSRANDVCHTIFAKYSANIMPKLCNTYETHQSTAVLQAISSFAKVCSSSVLMGILTGILVIGASVTETQQSRKAEQEVEVEETRETSRTRANQQGNLSQVQSTNNKESKAGNRVSSDAKKNGKEEGGGEEEDTRTTAQRRIVLDIACAVLPQLSVEQLTTLFREVIEPILIDPHPSSRLLQKKAYKLLHAVFEHRVHDVQLFFPRIAGAMALGRQHLTISGMKMRLRCLEWMLDACKMFYPAEMTTCVRSMIGEVVLCAREQAHETRLLAMSILDKMQRYFVQTAHAPVNALLHLILAGLSGKTAMMLSSTLVCAAKVVFLTHHELNEGDLDNITRVTFAMMESTMPEVRAAAAIFARMMLKLAKRSSKVHGAIARSLPLLLRAIALVTSQPRVSSGVRVQMRVLLEKCIKRFGYAELDPIFPLGSKNFLRYAHKMLKQEEKKAEQELRRRTQRQSQNAFDKLFMSSSAGVAADNVEDDLLEAGALTTFVAKHSTPIASSINMYGEESYDAPMLGSHLGSSSKNKQSGYGDDGELYEDEFDNMHLEFDGEKLRILSVTEKQGEDELNRKRALAQKLLGRAHAMANPDTLNADGVSRPGKRGRANEDEVQDIENEELILRYGNSKDQATSIAATAANNSMNSNSKMNGGKRSALRGSSSTINSTPPSPSSGSMTINGKLVGPSVRQITNLREQKREKQELKRRRVEEDIRKGEEFVGTGAGDVKRGNVDPFAYVPLNRRFMNRRNARQALHRFQILNTKQLKGEKAKTRALESRK